MATRRRTTRRRTTRKGAPRRTARLAYSRRPQGRVRRVRRRRKNPSVDYMGSAWAAVAGLVTAGGAYALDGVTNEKFTPGVKAGVIMGGGAALGLALNMVSQDIGKGVVAGAVALGGYQLMKQKMGKTKPATVGHALYHPPSEGGF